MAGKQIAGDGLSMNLAGMSKNQLYDIMSQMKVNHSLSLFSFSPIFFPEFNFLSHPPFPSLYFRNFLFLQTPPNLSEKI
jgi:hypothetical protein